MGLPMKAETTSATEDVELPSSASPPAILSSHFDDQQQQNGPPPLSQETLRLCLWTICTAGVLLNLLVFRKYRSSRCRHSPSVRSSLQLLCIMAGADTVSLLALMLTLGSRHLDTGHGQAFLRSLLCKLDLFLIHVSSAFGIWCWLVLSAVRYLAVRHPYTHLRLHKEPLLSVLCVAICCCLLEAWILFDVTFVESAKACGETLPEQLSKMLQLVEILWTYFLPLSIITMLDLKVLCCQSSSPWSSPTRHKMMAKFDSRPCALRQHNSSQSALMARSGTSDSGLCLEKGTAPCGGTTLLRISIPPLRTLPLSSSQQKGSRSRRRTQQLRILKRFLCISLIDLGMNLPNYLVRLYLTLVSEDTLVQVVQSRSFLWLQDLSQLLYFAQFSMNALYLVAINYVLPRQHTKSSTSGISSASVCVAPPSPLLCHQQKQQQKGKPPNPNQQETSNNNGGK